MTPTLFVGSMVGFIFSTLMNLMGMEGNHAVAYAMVGMAAFFATAAQAPLTALVMVVEFSMSGQMIYPLLIGVVSAYGTSKLIRARSMYAASLSGSTASVVNLPMVQVHVHDLARHVVPQVLPEASLEEVSSLMLKNPGDLIFVVKQDGTYLGTIYPGDVPGIRKKWNPGPGGNLPSAGNLIRPGAPVLDGNTHLTDALKLFEQDHLSAACRRVPGGRPSGWRAVPYGPVPGDYGNDETGVFRGGTYLTRGGAGAQYYNFVIMLSCL